MMSLFCFNDRRLWRKQAAAARALAETIAAPEDKAKMCEVAVAFDDRADRAGRRMKAAANSAKSPRQYPGTRVLIVEDDALIALLLAQLLEEMGCQVCASAATQAEAVDLALQHKPDLMIVDVHLRSGGGIAAVDEIERSAPIAHVFVAGAPEEVQARRPHAIAIAKPFRQGALTEAIKRALDAAPSL
jgi:two-component system, response regulator PdtaR